MRMGSVRPPAGDCGASFPADKNHQRGFGKKGAAHGENFLFFCRQERTGHFAKNPVQS